MDRRGFFRRTLGALVAAVMPWKAVAPVVDGIDCSQGGLATLIASTPTTGTVGGISRTAFTWYGSQKNFDSAIYYRDLERLRESIDLK
jgi:hypothetical protein